MKKKLNIGSGRSLRKGFINVDILDIKANNYVKADIRKLPFKDNSVEYVEMMSIIEHIPFREVAVALREVYRVMKPNVELVLLTDNFNGACIDWIRAAMGPGVGEDTMEPIYGNQKHKGEFHKSAFNPRLLYQALDSVGFRNIDIKNIPQNSPIPQFGTVPAQPDKFIRTDQLYARAKK